MLLHFKVSIREKLGTLIIIIGLALQSVYNKFAEPMFNSESRYFDNIKTVTWEGLNLYWLTDYSDNIDIEDGIVVLCLYSKVDC